MNKKETAVILEIIATMYQNKFKVENKQLLLDLWYDTLQDYEFDIISENVKAHYQTNLFPPSLAELIKVEKPEKRDRAVYNVEETQQMMLGWDNGLQQRATEEERNEALAKMRKILGIGRGV